MNLLGKNFIDIEKEILDTVEKRYRIKQIYDWVYRKFEFSPDNWSNLPKEMRGKISREFEFTPLKIIEKKVSDDKSIKYLLELADGKLIETVFIPQKGRISICLSSQVGCKFGCKFCLTGKMGFIRNLEYSEIVSQFITVLVDNKIGIGEKINIVFMGMGEPFDNYENLKKGIEVLTDLKGLSVSQRRITVSTIGLTDKVKNFIKDFPNVKLAISLNSPFPDKRGNIMPIEKTSPIIETIKFLKKNSRVLKHRITFEYIMLKGINDSKEDAKETEKITRGVPRKINLIPFNNFKGSNLIPSDNKTIDDFAEYLRADKIVVTVRDSKGKDIKASCGNLYAENKR